MVVYTLPPLPHLRIGLLLDFSLKKYQCIKREHFPQNVFHRETRFLLVSLNEEVLLPSLNDRRCICCMCTGAICLLALGLFAFFHFFHQIYFSGTWAAPEPRSVVGLQVKRNKCLRHSHSRIHRKLCLFHFSILTIIIVENNKQIP